MKWGGEKGQGKAENREERREEKEGKQRRKGLVYVSVLGALKANERDRRGLSQPL